jgi:hypothetical protein
MPNFDQLGPVKVIRVHVPGAGLHERGVLCVPDIVANAGGGICTAMEYAGAGQAAAAWKKRCPAVAGACSEALMNKPAALPERARCCSRRLFISAETMI